MESAHVSMIVVWFFGVVACRPSGTSPADAESSAAPVPDAFVTEASSDDAGTVDDASVHASPDQDASSVGANVPPDASTTLDANAEIRLHHGVCFGDCPELLLKLRADGSFTGRGAPKSLDAATTREVFELAEKAFDPPPRCPPGPTDIQYTTTTFVRDGKKRSAKHPRGSSCSKALSKLEKRLEAIR